jgi:hypothetical protein
MRGNKIVAVKKEKSVKGAGIQTIHSKRYALLVSAGLRITDDVAVGVVGRRSSSV